VPESDGYRLRWFTPAVEVELCGHATLASTHALGEMGMLAAGQTARFYTQSGLLTATHDDGWITLDFPTRLPRAVEAPSTLAAALGVAPVGVWRNDFDLLVELPTAADVRNLKPDSTAIKALGTMGVIVTGTGDAPGIDFVSRYFAPNVGIDEDPVTGGAHTTLAPFWSERLGKTTLTGYQASARGGTVRVKLQGERVLLIGQAVTVARCELVV
jgi:PhzF family phenazine biosynthesis protein